MHFVAPPLQSHRGGNERADALANSGRLAHAQRRQYPPPPTCISYALVQATVGVGTVIIVYVILITYEM